MVWEFGGYMYGRPWLIDFSFRIYFKHKPIKEKRIIYQFILFDLISQKRNVNVMSKNEKQQYKKHNKEKF